MHSKPLISCVMVTANRPDLCRRAVASFKAQTYPNRELVVLDNGVEPARDSFSSLNGELVYRYQPPDSSATLGELRNQSVKMARGQVLVPHWDDDDWCHSERLSVQFEHLNSSGSKACLLGATLMHIDDSEYFERPYYGWLSGGVPPTIMHWRDDNIRFLPLRRSEDSHYIRQWNATVLPIEYAYLHVRFFHGDNTWEKEHFLRRLRNSPSSLARWWWWKHIMRNEDRHPRFRLDDRARDAFASYLQASRDLGLFSYDTESPRPLSTD